ncbi:unnamed protein product [Orchesella dallaii]|uniref:Uncharacterized protein n=1 Tax=Orchesella dallaii TaxID=48710 RepID=A0ABP1R620_9HEXA
MDLLHAIRLKIMELHAQLCHLDQQRSALEDGKQDGQKDLAETTYLVKQKELTDEGNRVMAQAVTLFYCWCHMIQVKLNNSIFQTLPTPTSKCRERLRSLNESHRYCSEIIKGIKKELSSFDYTFDEQLETLARWDKLCNALNRFIWRMKVSISEWKENSHTSITTTRSGNSSSVEPQGSEDVGSSCIGVGSSELEEIVMKSEPN